MQEKFIFFPVKGNVQTPSYIQDYNLQTSDGETLSVWYQDNQSDKTVLFFHGNAGNLSHRVTQTRVFQELQLNALLIDYRGYGNSTGKVTKESDLSIDAKTAYDFLVVDKNIDPNDIIIWGRSLGGAIAIDLASQFPHHKLIIESTFSSMSDMAKKQFWFLPSNLLLKYRFESDEKIKSIENDILIMHSKQDQVIGYENGEKLHNNSGENAVFVEKTGGHNDLYSPSYDWYIDTIKKFLYPKQ